MLLGFFLTVVLEGMEYKYTLTLDRGERSRDAFSVCIFLHAHISVSFAWNGLTFCMQSGGPLCVICIFRLFKNVSNVLENLWAQHVNRLYMEYATCQCLVEYCA